LLRLSLEKEAKLRLSEMKKRHKDITKEVKGLRETKGVVPLRQREVEYEIGHRLKFSVEATRAAHDQHNIISPSCQGSVTTGHQKFGCPPLGVSILSRMAKIGRGN